VAVDVDVLLREGEQALRRGDGLTARRAFMAVSDRLPTGRPFEGIARADYILGEYAASIVAHERAFMTYREEGDALGAARCARMLYWLHANMYGDAAVANGWAARASTVLERSAHTGAVAGWIEALAGLIEPDLGRRVEHMRTALVIARETDDRDLEFEALGWQGLARVLLGDTAGGMPLLDEALTAVCAGEVEDLYVVEGVCCGMFWACEHAHDIVRAEQWLRAVAEFAQRRGLSAVGGFCRAHYGSILTAAGRWSEAERELTEAARITEHGYSAMRSEILVRLADLRVRQGRFEEAEQLLDGLDHREDAVPPLAAVRLARGQTEHARDLLERALPPGERSVSDGPVLALLVDAHLAAGDLVAADSVTCELAQVGRSTGSSYVVALAALARGRVCLASGSRDARTCLHEALMAFGRAQMPVEAARARLELARALSVERPSAAVAEARAALNAFERLEAAHDADAAAALLRSLGAQGRTSPRTGADLTRREAEVLDLVCRGLSNQEIAVRLFISAKTVEHHVGRVLGKLGLRNRAEATAYVIRSGQPNIGA
jgi:DNA-binding CsgD family transcriptional regulator